MAYLDTLSAKKRKKKPHDVDPTIVPGLDTSYWGDFHSLDGDFPNGDFQRLMREVGEEKARARMKHIVGKTSE